MLPTDTIATFYDAFGRKDAETMAACYASDIHFTDPVFGDLYGDEAVAMWRMLCTQASELEVTASDIRANGGNGTASWEAIYTFGPSERTVHNRIAASFEFDESGLIVRHIDRFDLWRWARMAIGPMGVFLGWAPFFRTRLRQTARRGLDRFRSADGTHGTPEG